MEYALEIKNLSKIYKDQKNKYALNNINLKIKKGTFLGLLGHNGAGKSTLINIIGGSVLKSSGQILINGYNIDKHSSQAKQSLGIVPQDIVFDPFFTPLESIILQSGLWGIKTTKKEALAVLKELGLEDKAYSYSRTLSGGMKRRILIAKALIHKPDILILDEPTAGVDLQLRQTIWNYIEKINQNGTTIILTTHYLEEAQKMCNEIAIIRDGEIVTHNTTQELLEKVGIKQLEITFNEDCSDKINTLLKKFKVKLINNNTLDFELNNNQSTGAIINEISNQKLTIDQIKTRESSLEDVFLELGSKK